MRKRAFNSMQGEKQEFMDVFKLFGREGEQISEGPFAIDLN